MYCIVEQYIRAGPDIKSHFSRQLQPPLGCQIINEHRLRTMASRRRRRRRPHEWDDFLEAPSSPHTPHDSNVCVFWRRHHNLQIHIRRTQEIATLGQAHSVFGEWNVWGCLEGKLHRSLLSHIHACAAPIEAFVRRHIL